MKKIIGSSIKTKLVVIFLAIALVPLAILGAATYLSSKSALTNQITQDFDAIANGKETAVVQYLMGAKRALAVYSHAKTIFDNLVVINNKTADTSQAAKILQDYIDERLKVNPLVQEFIIMDHYCPVV